MTPSAVRSASATVRRSSFTTTSLSRTAPPWTWRLASLFDAGVGALTAFVKAGLVASTGEARRQIKAGGLRVNDIAVSDERAVLSRDQLVNGAVKLSLGKKKHVLLRPE